MQSPPHNLMEAATHIDPYPYYATLAARGSLYHDEVLNLWIATRWQSMEAVLGSDICRTRPLTEPIPNSIAGKPAGDIFRHLVRMTDGPHHCPLKSAIAATLDTIASERLAYAIDEGLSALDQQLAPGAGNEALTRFIYSVPVQVLAGLLGVPAPHLESVTQWVDHLVVAFTPVATAGEVVAGNHAASELLALFGDLSEGNKDGLLGILAANARHAGRTEIAPIIANGIGFLSQAYEGTAALIANTLLALARHEASRTALARNSDLAPGAVAEILRYDPPAQNTRRFVAQEGVVAGQPMRQGDVILVLLGAAGRDPAANPEPDRFDLFRSNRRSFNFGACTHACPGDGIATVIAERTVRYLLSRVDYERLAGTLSHRRSVSVRAPLFWAPSPSSAPMSKAP